MLAQCHKQGYKLLNWYTKPFFTVVFSWLLYEKGKGKSFNETWKIWKFYNSLQVALSYFYLYKNVFSLCVAYLRYWDMHQWQRKSHYVRVIRRWSISSMDTRWKSMMRRTRIAWGDDLQHALREPSAHAVWLWGMSQQPHVNADLNANTQKPCGLPGPTSIS